MISRLSVLISPALKKKKGMKNEEKKLSSMFLVFLLVLSVSEGNVDVKG